MNIIRIGILTGLISILMACGGQSPDISTQNNILPKPLDLKVASGKACVKVASVFGNILVYSYENDTLDSGDHFVTCSISGSATQSSESHFYKPGTVGATTGDCFNVYDLNTPSGGSWHYYISGGTIFFRYADSGSTHDLYTDGFSPSQCNSI